MKIVLITIFFALSFANYDFGFNHPRKSVTSSKWWQKSKARLGRCRRAKCPKDEDFCENPRCYPHKDIEKALEKAHILNVHVGGKVHSDIPRSSGNHSKILFLIE